MRTLRFHRNVYSGRAVDEVLGRFERFARIERREDGDYFVVDITSTPAARERKIAGELANHALGLTLERGGPDAPEGEP